MSLTFAVCGKRDAKCLEYKDHLLDATCTNTLWWLDKFWAASGLAWLGNSVAWVLLLCSHINTTMSSKLSWLNILCSHVKVFYVNYFTHLRANCFNPQHSCSNYQAFCESKYPSPQVSGKNIAKPTHTTEWDKHNIIAIISIF